MFRENGKVRVLKDDDMAKHLGIRVENLRKRTPAELDQLGLKPIEPVGAGLPINCEYAGRVYFEELPARLRLKYPDGVRFSEKGFPEFSPYAEQERSIVLTGDRTKDFQAANKLRTRLAHNGFEWARYYTWAADQRRRAASAELMALNRQLNTERSISALILEQPENTL